MKTTFCASGFFFAISILPCQAALITQSPFINLRFLDTVQEIPIEGEPLRFGAEAGDTIYLLDLGRYSSADTGQTFSFMRDAATTAQWDAVSHALQGDPFQNTTGLPTLWLGSDALEENDVSTSSPFSRGRMSAGIPTYNLQRVDVTVRYYRTGTDDGIRFRTATFDANFFWLIPEPATWTLAMVPAFLLPRRHRIKGVRRRQ